MTWRKTHESSGSEFPPGPGCRAGDSQFRSVAKRCGGDLMVKDGENSSLISCISLTLLAR